MTDEATTTTDKKMVFVSISVSVMFKSPPLQSVEQGTVEVDSLVVAFFSSNVSSEIL